jgi:hypothetical protein
VKRWEYIRRDRAARHGKRWPNLPYKLARRESASFAPAGRTMKLVPVMDDRAG